MDYGIFVAILITIRVTRIITGDTCELEGFKIVMGEGRGGKRVMVVGGWHRSGTT